jgi:hypothetical protein
MDYAVLRSEGIRLLERLGGQVWTDFNAHDPGITILEQLCYAITDLGYRINYDIKDLLAADDDPYRSLYSPAKILTTNPVTLNDLRKLVIDVAGVKNAWIEAVAVTDPSVAGIVTAMVYDPSELALYLENGVAQPPHRQPVLMRGLYRILIEKDENLGLYASTILPEVNRRLHACRSLGEDFIPPVFLDRQSIIVQTQIEIGPVEDPEQLLAQIYQTLSLAISPRIRFYTLTEMLNQGRPIDQVQNGPALEHGFIDDMELVQFQRKSGLRSSDLLQEIMAVGGVTAVNNLSIGTVAPTEEWYLKLPPDSAPFLDIDRCLFDANGPTIALTRGGILMRLDPASVKENILRLQQSASNAALPPSGLDIVPDAGQDQHAGQYYSFQHQFPPLYGIGAIGLPESTSPERKAQSKQLKAYLLFFDQLLANYFAQLSQAKDLFSFYAPANHTYFSQAIDDPELGLDDIRIGDSVTHARMVQGITEDPSLGTTPAGRKNRFLNHLLARFAEQFTDFSLLQYSHMGENDLIADKSAFLQDYQAIGAARGTGFNYTLPAWGTDNISGLEKRISRKLGLSSYRLQDLAGLAADAEGGFHALEHILLRPRLADNGQTTQTSGISWQTAFLALPESRDPYSHQLSFIFPDWIAHFTRDDFRELVKKTLREETPAHLHITLHWLNQSEMLTFETALKTWLDSTIGARAWDPIDVSASDAQSRMTVVRLRDARDQMMQLLGIGIPYPLRDLTLNHDAIVAYNHPAPIQIMGGQAGVRYQLCDEDGNPILDSGGKPFEVTPQSGQAPDSIYLNTPAIQKDITFTILAIRAAPGLAAPLEAYLNQPIAIQAGIDVTLPAAFLAAAGQVVRNGQLISNYNDTVAVIVSNSQEGISYKLVANGKDLSAAKKGNKGDITLLSSTKFPEDATINILAFRTASVQIFAQLDVSLSILVRPDPARLISINKTVVDYQAQVTLSIAAPQASVEYRLYKRDVNLSEYLPDATPGALLITTPEQRNIAIKMPSNVTDWTNPAGFTPYNVFKGSNKLNIDSGALLEDTVFIVQATKNANREQLQLAQTMVVLVRPNPASAVSVAVTALAAGGDGLVQVSGTQKGVAYQLRLDPANTPVNPPGYHLTDRAIETMRVEVDFVVTDQGATLLLLPTGPISQAATFNVLAYKVITGVNVQLTGKATISVTTP